MNKIRVLLADDQDIIRTGLTIILNHQPDIEVVGQAADGYQNAAPEWDSGDATDCVGAA